MVYVEQKHLHLNPISPIMCMGVPTLGAVILGAVIGPYLNFISFNNEAIDILICGFSFFWLGGMFITLFLPKHIRQRKIVGRGCGHIHPRFINITCFVLVIIAILGLRQTLAESGGDMEKGDYGSHGIVGHVNGFIMGYCVFYILSLKYKLGVNRLWAIIMICIILFLKIMTGIRGNIVLPLLGGFIALGVTKSIKISFRSFLYSIGGVIILFVGTTFLFNNKYNIDTTEFLGSYLFFYMTSGVFGLNSLIENKMVVIGQNPEYIFTFFKNLLIAVFGGGEKYAQLVQPDFAICTTSEAIYPFASNVYTLVGDIYINTGYTLGSIFFFVLGIYCYFLFYFSYKSVFLISLYSFVAANLALGLFSQYILYIYFYTVQAFLLMLHFLSKIRFSNYEVRSSRYSI